MRKVRNYLACLVALMALVLTAIAPVTANAQSSYQHRQDTKNTWRNLSLGGAALGALGLLTKNNTLMWAGLAGGLYSAYRYEQDRRSQNRMVRNRALMFSKPVVWYKGHKYVRRTVWRNHHKYYTFVRVR